MRRHAFRILLCLVLGVVTTVGVAWGCALWSDLQNRRDDGDTTNLARLRLDLVGKFTVDGSIREGFGARHCFATIAYSDGRSGRTRVNTVHVYQHGWPWYTMEGEHRFGDDVENDGLHGLLAIRRPRGGYDRFIGLRPVFPGFALGTLSVAGAGLVMMYLPAFMRVVLRRCRGRCPACGYDLRGAEHGACPECGAPAT